MPTGAQPSGPSNTPASPSGALTVDQAANLLASRRATVVADNPTPPVQDEPEVTADLAPETPEEEDEDLSLLVPDEDQAPTSTDEPTTDEDSPQAEETTEADDGDAIIETPDGRKIRASEAVKALDRVNDLVARVSRAEQRFAEARKEIQAQHNQLATHRTELDNKAAHLDSLISEYQGNLDTINNAVSVEEQQWSRVDWDAIEDEDPSRARKLERQYQRFKERKRIAAEEKQRVADQRRQEAENEVALRKQNFHRFVAQEFPDLADPKDTKGQRQAMIKVAQAAGYSQAEIEHVDDPRMLVLWDWATKFRQLLHLAKNQPQTATTAKKPPVKEESKKPATAGFKVLKSSTSTRPNVTRSGPTQEVAALGRAEAKFQKTGDPRDAQAVMAARRAVQSAGQRLRSRTG